MKPQDKHEWSEVGKRHLLSCCEVCWVYLPKTCMATRADGFGGRIYLCEVCDNMGEKLTCEECDDTGCYYCCVDIVCEACDDKRCNGAPTCEQIAKQDGYYDE